MQIADYFYSKFLPIFFLFVCQLLLEFFFFGVNNKRNSNCSRNVRNTYNNKNSVNNNSQNNCQMEIE